MPLPPVDATPQEIEELGWKKVVVWEWISVEGGKIIYRKMQYNVTKIGYHGMCSACKSTDTVYLTVMPTGVRKMCLICGVTTGPLPYEEDKEPVGEMLEERPVNRQFAFQIIMKTNAPIPIGLSPRRRRKSR